MEKSLIKKNFRTSNKNSTKVIVRFPCRVIQSRLLVVRRIFYWSEKRGVSQDSNDVIITQVSYARKKIRIRIHVT